MVIKSSKHRKPIKLGILIGFLILIGTISLMKENPYDINSLNNPESYLNTNTPPIVVVDKVYNFTTDRPYIFFQENLYFEQSYNYYITVCIVTPHSCDLNITLWDPEGDEFQLSYEETMVQNDYREVPFGVAIKGNYSILFSAKLTENFNMLINIERGGICLYDKILTEELPYLIFSNVMKFYNGTHISHSITLKTDMYYQFYFGRVSAISRNLSSYTALVHTIFDETQGILFNSYTNTTVASPKEVTSYSFGTAIHGGYTVNLTIYCVVEAVNIAYAVVEKQRIADGTDPNDDEPPPTPEDPINGTGIEAFIPTEWIIGMIIFVASAVSIPIIAVVYRKTKNPSGL
ncbi:MAG: hypothetical protein JSV62_13025 [Promethearchaeota archaeon]|nr:MAG: hypothetical protein JSV62_13025 [Candidatus Lokiarchaeota archaeon]